MQDNISRTQSLICRRTAIIHVNGEPQRQYRLAADNFAHSATKKENRINSKYELTIINSRSTIHNASYSQTQ